MDKKLRFAPNRHVKRIINEDSDIESEDNEIYIKHIEVENEE